MTPEGAIFTLWIILGLAVNAVVGYVVLALVDHKDERLYRWYSSAPLVLVVFCVLTLWPYVAYKFRKTLND